MKTKILPNIFISVAVFFALTRLVTAGPSDGVLNFNDNALIPRQPTIITFDAPGAGTGPFQGTQPSAINPAGVICGVISDANRVFSSQCSRAREAGLI